MKIKTIIMIGFLSLFFIACGSSNSKTISSDNNTTDVNITTITHNGTDYNTVTSAFTGKVWLDRNLGAARVCESFDDEACFGDYYQWGRDFDGHQRSNSEKTNVLANDVNNIGHGDFIVNNTTSNDWVSSDSVGNIRFSNWTKIDASTVCPLGFRVPTPDEFKLEILNNNVTNNIKAFENFLKLPSAGVRNNASALIEKEGSIGGIWTSIVDNSRTKAILFGSNFAVLRKDRRDKGLSVRCIESDTSPIVHNGTSYGTVTLPLSGKVWLDRNLGAKRICENFDDEECFGDYYQWGRNFDGHQNPRSGTTSIQATTINTAGTSFIISDSSPFDWLQGDVNGAIRSAQWSNTNGTSVCPVGFRVPTIEELKLDIENDIFLNLLKIPLTGDRVAINGLINAIDRRSILWSSSRDKAAFVFQNLSPSFQFSFRGIGGSVRCLKD